LRNQKKRKTAPRESKETRGIRGKNDEIPDSPKAPKAAPFRGAGSRRIEKSARTAENDETPAET
jgi:hypothetical protein